MSQPRLLHQIAADLTQTLIQLRAQSRLTQARLAARMSTTRTAVAPAKRATEPRHASRAKPCPRQRVLPGNRFIRSHGAEAKTGCILIVDTYGEPETDQQSLDHQALQEV